MDRVLLIGSGNRDKAAELAELLVGLPWAVRGLNDFPALAEPEEAGIEPAELLARLRGRG